ncbi:hypothetical protein ACFONN_13255 [Dyella humi]|uniref:Uncharacterized protein n=1 Tax=Dyella humi TaxID=1770547 RepID=A0ABW8IL84_9GAMM
MTATLHVGSTTAPTNVIVPPSIVPPPPALTADDANTIATEQLAKTNQRRPRMMLPSTGTRASART